MGSEEKSAHSYQRKSFVSCPPIFSPAMPMMIRTMEPMHRKSGSRVPKFPKVLCDLLKTEMKRPGQLSRGTVVVKGGQSGQEDILLIMLIH